MANSGSRLGYLDWLRGVTVLVMIEAHAFDAWTRPEDKTREVYGWLMVLGGMAAPAFLFMAGVAVALAAAAQLRRGATPAEAARRVERRGWQIFLFAFLFRLQSYVLGGFSNAPGLLKVDILNIMGPAIAATASTWRLGGGRWRRASDRKCGHETCRHDLAAHPRRGRPVLLFFRCRRWLADTQGGR